jgi:glycosyltransferase involved in cell wall biosynthesis
MRIGLNLIFLVPGETGGMETVARELIPAMRALTGHTLVAFVNEEARSEDFGAHEQVVVPVRARSRAQWVLGEQRHLPSLAAGCDVVHSLGSTAPARGPFRRLVTINDLHYRTMPEAHFGLRGLGMRVLVPLAARSSHMVLTISNAARADIVRLLGVPPAKVRVVYPGIAAPSAAPTPEADLRRLHWLEDRPVLLAMSAKRPHKNIAGLLDALAQIAPPRPVLVLPGYPTEHEDELRRRAHALGVDGDVRFLGWVSDADAEGLHALADAFVHPAFSEGFGLPPVEALARGLPVACSDIPVLREVMGDEAIFFDPHAPASIAAAVRAALATPRIRPRPPVRFTWEAAAAGTLEAYECLSRQSTTSRSRERS